MALLAAAGLHSGCNRETATAPSSKTTTPPEILALVNGEKVTVSDVQEVAAKNAYDLAKKDEAVLALRDAVNFEVLAIEAKRAGYFDDPEVMRMARNLAVQKLIKDKVDGSQQETVLSEAELKDYYTKNIATFSNPTLAKGQMLVLIKRAGQEDAFARKLEAAQKAITEGQNFAEVVKTYSDNPADQTNGGISNWITQGKPSERYPQPVIDALFSLTSQDAPRGPIETPQGTWFVKLVERRDGGPIDYEQAKRTISQQLYRQKRLSVYDGYVGKLKKDITVQEFPERLEAALEKSRGQSGPPMGPVRVAK